MIYLLFLLLGFFGFRFVAPALGYIVVSKKEYDEEGRRRCSEILAEYKRRLAVQANRVRKYEVSLKQTIRNLEHHIGQIAYNNHIDAMRFQSVLQEVTEMRQPMEAYLEDQELKDDLGKVREDLSR